MDPTTPNNVRSIFGPKSPLFHFGKAKAAPPAPAEALVPNPWAALEDKADPHVPTATLQIYAFINKELGRHETDTHIDRASMATYCVKRRWYQGQGFKGEPLTPRRIVNFLLGDLSERTLQHFIREGCVGPGKLYSEVDFGEVLGEIHFQGKPLKIYKQQDLVVTVRGFGAITAHADGFGRRNSDGKWELIECKSAANWGFNDFKDVGPKEYLNQSTTLMQTDKARALGVQHTRYFYLRKETGHIWDRVFTFDPQLWKEVIAEYKTARSTKEPAAPHALIRETYRRQITGRKIAAFPCSYCPYLERCHGKYEVDWKADQFGHKKPIYVFNSGSTL